MNVRAESEAFFRIGFGTWRLGGGNEPDPQNDDAGDIAAVRRAVDAGIRHIDTAELYADGKAEELVGEAVRPYRRNGLFIASKVRDTKLHYDDILENCARSLERLGTNYLDLYYIHKPNPDIPAEETARAFNVLLKQGKIRHVGISNATVETMEKYGAFLDRPLFAAQCHYNLIVREPARKGVLEYCRRKGIRFIAWRPIQLPSEKFGIHALYERGVYPILDQTADRYGLTNAQVAVKWLIAQENVGTIFKTKNPRHLADILAVQDIDIAPEDLHALTDGFPRQEDEGFTTTGRAPLI
ncbi:MAG: aldo/keto reductase [Alphaproteobacteria bacterium]|jgi:aryl-alcohol dehydrogenase-like predicted oxidoreductase